MKKNAYRLFVGVLALCFITCSFQISGRTRDGDEVLLESDGTWKYSTAKKYSKSLLATKSVTSKEVPIQVSFDPEYWNCKPGEDGEEYSFFFKKDDVRAMFFAGAISIPSDMARKTILESDSDPEEDTQIVVEEDRIVNGLPLKYFEYSSICEGAQFTYMLYVFCGEEVSVHFTAIALTNKAYKYKKVMEDLLNGITLSKAT